MKMNNKKWKYEKCEINETAETTPNNQSSNDIETLKKENIELKNLLNNTNFLAKNNLDLQEKIEQLQEKLNDRSSIRYIDRESCNRCMENYRDNIKNLKNEIEILQELNEILTAKIKETQPIKTKEEIKHHKTCKIAELRYYNRQKMPTKTQEINGYIKALDFVLGTKEEE